MKRPGIPTWRVAVTCQIDIEAQYSKDAEERALAEFSGAMAFAEIDTTGATIVSAERVEE